MTKAVAQVQQIQKEMAGITTQEIKPPIQSQIETKGADLKTELSVDNPANDSEERMLLEKETTMTEETHKWLYKKRKRTKYTTQMRNVFKKKDINEDIISRNKQRSSSQISSRTSFSIQNVLP